MGKFKGQEQEERSTSDYSKWRSKMVVCQRIKSVLERGPKGDQTFNPLLVIWASGRSFFSSLWIIPSIPPQSLPAGIKRKTIEIILALWWVIESGLGWVFPLGKTTSTVMVFPTSPPRLRRRLIDRLLYRFKSAIDLFWYCRWRANIKLTKRGARDLVQIVAASSSGWARGGEKTMVLVDVKHRQAL